MVEEWRNSTEPGIMVSSRGRILGKRGACRKLFPDSNGYASASVYTNGKTRTLRAHIEVALAFIGPRPEGKQVAHLDGDRMNAAVTNLAYKTRSENEADKALHGTQAVGTRNGQCKLSDEEAKQVVARVRAGEPQKDIARHLGVSRSLVCRIAKGSRANVPHQSHFAGDK